MSVPDEAVEAAARVQYEAELGINWSGQPSPLKRGYLDDARRMLEAAAPLIAAQAWDEGWKAGAEWMEPTGPNPYRSGS